MLVTVPRRCWDGCSACQTVRTAGWHSALHPGWSHSGLSGSPDKGKAHAVTQSSWIKQGSINPWPPWVHSNSSSPPHLLCPGWRTNIVPGLSKERHLSPPGDQAMGSGRQCWASAPAQFLSVKITICQLGFNWAWYAGRRLCQQKWEFWICNCWAILNSVLKGLSSCPASLTRESSFAHQSGSLHINVHCYFHLCSSKSGKNQTPGRSILLHNHYFWVSGPRPLKLESYCCESFISTDRC